jgi:hypothetical protein
LVADLINDIAAVIAKAAAATIGRHVDRIAHVCVTLFALTSVAASCRRYLTLCRSRQTNLIA